MFFVFNLLHLLPIDGKRRSLFLFKSSQKICFLAVLPLTKGQKCGIVIIR
jgi:hypothetical protein